MEIYEEAMKRVGGGGKRTRTTRKCPWTCATNPQMAPFFFFFFSRGCFSFCHLVLPCWFYPALIHPPYFALAQLQDESTPLPGPCALERWLLQSVIWLRLIRLFCNTLVVSEQPGQNLDLITAQSQHLLVGS